MIVGGLCLALAAPSRAIVGVGVHWGFDFSLDMPDMSGTNLDVQEYLPGGFDAGTVIGTVENSIRNDPNLTLTPQLDSLLDSVVTLITNDQVPQLTTQLPMTFNRIDFERTPINFGGKVYIDIIPVLDAIEVSFNLGAWEYYGFITYPSGIDPSIDGVSDVDFSDPAGLSYTDLFTMDTLDLTLEAFGKNFLWFDKTPLMKLQFDLTVRKNIIAIPGKMKIFKLYGGGGPSVHFATPLLTEEFVMNVIRETIEESGQDFATVMNPDDFMNPENGLGDKIMQKLLEQSLVPKWGMHLLVGTHIKPPILPLGFYGDAKLMIPFGAYNEEAQLKGYGFLFNVGITLGL
jgi:hypothetical protein